MDDSSTTAPLDIHHVGIHHSDIHHGDIRQGGVAEPTLVHSLDARPGDPTSTGVMKALLLVDHLREERRTADNRRLAALMGRS